MMEMYEEEKQELEERVEEKEVCRAILQHGKDILKSDIFKETAFETHHLHGTVLEHTLNVCIVCMWLCRQLKNRGAKINEKDLIQAALCHDLGMVGRESKYKDRLNSWGDHPKESMRIAKELVPDLSEEAADMILNHMWPISGSMPRSNEAMILCIADKYASMADWATWLTRQRFAAHIKEQLDEAMSE